MQGDRELSTAEVRRRSVARAALEVFARSGYATSPVTQVAEHAGISSAYVMKLFPRKVDLFVAAIDTCYDRIIACLESALDDDGDTAADDAAGSDVDDADRRAHGDVAARLLDRMGAAYAALIADRDLLLLQVQALAAAGIPEVAEAVRRGTARLITTLTSGAGASGLQAQQFIARGQLCHLLTAIDAFDVDQPWATTLTAGIRHLR